MSWVIVGGEFGYELYLSGLSLEELNDLLKTAEANKKEAYRKAQIHNTEIRLINQERQNPRHTKIAPVTIIDPVKGAADKVRTIKEMVKALLQAGVDDTNEFFQEAWSDYESGSLDTAMQRFHELMHREGIQEDTAQAMALHKTLSKKGGWIIKAVDQDTVLAYIDELEAHGINEYTEGHGQYILRADLAFQDGDYETATEILRGVMSRAGLYDDIQGDLS